MGSKASGTGTARADGGPPQGLSPSAVARSTVLLIALRVGYAYNWLAIGPALPSIGSTFGVGPADWGLLVAAFLVGAGLFQVPAGFLARRSGPRTVALVGAGALAVGSLASALAPNFEVLWVTRLAAGMGAALFFSPAIGLVGRLYPPGRRGLPVGTFSSAFSGGAALGLLGTALLIPVLGWRGAIAAGAVGLAALALLGLALIPRSAGALPRGRPAPSRKAPAALRYRGVWAVGFAFIGLEGATFATGQFIVPYGVAVEGWSLGLAGAVGIAFVLPSLFGGPVGGSIAERRTNHRSQLAVATLASAVAVAAIPVAGLVLAVLIGIGFSFAYGVVYAVMYVLPHHWGDVPPDEVPLAIGLFNSIQLAGGAVVSAAFGWLVAVRSYSIAWEYLALAVVVSLVALAALPPTRGGAGPPAEAEHGPPAAPGP